MGVSVSGAASAGDCCDGMALAGKSGVASDGASFAARGSMDEGESDRRGWRNREAGAANKNGRRRAHKNGRRRRIKTGGGGCDNGILGWGRG